MPEDAGRHGVQRRDVTAGLAVAGQAEERRVDAGGVDAGLSADVRDTLGQNAFHDVKAVVGSEYDVGAVARART